MQHRALRKQSSTDRDSSASTSAVGRPSLASRAAAALAAGTISLASLLAPAQLPLPLPLAPAEAQARTRLTPEEQLTIDVFKRNVPSVVNVTNLAVRRDAFTMNMLEIPQGAGSGFVWDDKGHVVTNYHVIQDASDIQVTALGGDEYSARVIGVDRDKDIAVLQIIGRPGVPDDQDLPFSASGPRPTNSPAAQPSSPPSAAAEAPAAARLSPDGTAHGGAAAAAAAGGAQGAQAPEHVLLVC